jgi:hypothetical protein
MEIFENHRQIVAISHLSFIQRDAFQEFTVLSLLHRFERI